MSLQDVVEATGAGSHRRQRRVVEKRRRNRRRRTWVVVLVSLIVVGGAVGGAWLGLRPIIASMTAPDDWTGDGTGQVTVTIPAGASGSAMASVLADAGVVKTAKAFSKAYSADPHATGIQPGTYRLRSHMSAAAAVGLLLQPASRLTVKVTIPEGKRTTQILDLIAKQTGLTRAVIDKAAKDTTAIGLPAEAKGNLEGYLYPSTYAFGPGVSATEVLRTMIAQEQVVMNTLGVAPEKQRDLLIQASLVQAEAGKPTDMGKIARVLQNRLDKGMKLSLDTTVHYATGKFTLSTSTKDTQINSPYNTYVVPRLPVGPICSPGEVALKAVLDPTPGPWMYFTTVNPDTGETEFAVTLAEKDKMDAKWRAWKAKHPGQ